MVKEKNIVWTEKREYRGEREGRGKMEVVK